MPELRHRTGFKAVLAILLAALACVDVQAQDVSVAKDDGSATYVPGTTTTYTVVVTNNGVLAASDVLISDPEPTGPVAATFTSWTCTATGGATCPNASGTGSIAETVPSLPGGDSLAYSVVADIPSDALDPLTNEVSATSPDIDPLPGNNTASDTNTAEPSADLSITKTGSPDPALPGQPFSWTIAVDNLGPSDAPVTTSDSVPPEVTGLSIGGADGASCTVTGQLVACDFGSVPAGTTRTYTITGDLDASATGSIDNTATVTAGGTVTDPVPGNDTSNSITPVIDSSNSIAKTASPASGTVVAVGDTITYTLTTTVSGASTTDPIVLTDTLDAGLSTVTPLPPECSQVGQVLTCTIPAGTPLGDYVISYAATVNPAAGASVGNAVTGGDTCPSCSTMHAVARGISLTKTWADAADGDTVTLSIAGDTGEVLDSVGGSSTAGGSSTDATANAIGGAAVDISEAFSVGDPLNYATQYECVRVSDGAVLASGTGAAGSFTMPSDTGAACTFTNARQAASLSLSKQWNDALQGDIAIVSSNGFTNDSTLSSTADATGDNVTIGPPATVYAGDSGTIDETVSNPGNYNSTLACSGNTQPLSGNTLTIDPADTDVTCTWTNARKPVNLVLQKTWMSAAIGETVDVTATGSATSPIVLNSVADTATETDNIQYQVYAGETLVLSETFATAGNDANYASELACTGTTGLSGDTLVVGPDDTDITCTFTNTRRQATLQLAKAWGANSGTGDQAQIGPTTGLVNNTAGFIATAPTPNNSGPAVTVYAGEQATLPAETMAALDNYGVALACTGGALSGTDGKASNTLDIQVADEGTNIVCTYTNLRVATTLTLQKVWLNAIAGDSIEIVADRPAGGLTPLASTATGGATQTDTGAAQDIYAGEVIQMGESFLNGTSSNYAVTLECTNTDGLVTAPSGIAGTLTVGPDDGPITCTWTNDRLSAELLVQKVWSGPSPGATVDIPATTGFTNNTPAFSSTFPTNDQVGPVEVFVEEEGTLAPESFTDGDPGDYDSTLSCDGTDTEPGNGLVINLADAGSTITCTYSNAFVPDPELTVTKSPDVATVTAAGDVITYDISVQNTGNVPLSNVTVDDPLIAATLLCTPAVPVATLAPGATITCQGTYTVTQADIDRSGSGDGVDDGVISNQVTTNATDDDGTPVNASDEADVTLPAQVFTVDFTKTPTLDDSDGSGAGSAGETIAYSFSVTNSGNSTIETITITDPLLPGLTCGVPDPIAPGETVTFGPSAPPADVACTGAEYVITQADIDAQGGGDIDIDNEATADGTGPNGGTASTDATSSQAIDLAQPIINLDKSASPASATEPGQTITYTFVVTNPGNVTLTGVTITDPLPGLGPFDCGADTLPTDLAPGGSVTCTAQYTVTQADIDGGGAITNTADADGTYDGTDVNDEDSASVDVDPGPGTAELVKTADTTFVTNVGEVVTYTFSVNNPGPRTLTNLQITNDTLLGAGLSCDIIPTLVPGGSAAFTCTGNTYTVQQSDIDNQGNPVTDSGELVNTVTGQAEYTDGGDTVMVTDTDSWAVELPPRGPQMVVTKTPDVGSVPGPGALITYSFQVENIGNVTLENLTVNDPLLPGLSCSTIVSLAPGQSASFLFCSNNVYTVTQDDIDSGSSDFQPGDGQIDNEATVDAGVPGGTALQASDQAEVNLPVRQPAMSLVKSADPASVVAPGTIEYAFTVTNDGNVTINDIDVSDPTLGLSCPPVASLAPGASVTLDAAFGCTGTTREVTQVEIDAGGTLDNTATASGLTDAGGPTPLTATDSLQIPIDQDAGLAFTKAANADIVNNPGDAITYTITGNNTGNVTLQNVDVVDPLVAATLSCTPATPIATLAPGEGFSCTGTYIVTQEDFDTRGGGDGVIENTATANWTGGSQNASDGVDIAPQTQSLTIDKTAGTPTIDQGADSTVTDAGDTIPYTFVVENTGNVTLADLAITDPNLDGPATCDKTDLPATAPPDSVATCTGVHTITQAEMDAGIVTNSATAQGTPPGSSRISSQPDTADVILDREPAIELTKTASAPTVNLGALPTVTDAGDQVIYSFTVENTGNVTLRAVDVSDALVPGVDLVCSPLQLQPGQVADCGTATYTLTQVDIDAGVVSNDATATGLDPDDATVSDDASVDVPISPAPGLTLDKSPSPTQVSVAGETVTYSFEVTNTGNVTITDLAIDETAFSGTGTPPVIACPATTLAPAASTTCTGTYAVTQADLDAGEITNTATANGTDPAGAAVASAPDDAVVTVDENALLTLLKTATPGTVSTVGETVTYSFEVTNTGNVTITDLAIDETAFSGTGTPPVIACPTTTLAPAAGTTCTGTYAVTQADLDAGEISNTATANGTDPAGVPVISVPDEAVVTVDENAALALVKTATPGTVSTVGETVTYSFEVTNTGNVTITNLLIDETAFSGTGTPPVIACPATTLAPAAGTTCTGTYAVTQADLDAGEITNTATANGTDPAGAAVASAPDDAVVTVDENALLTLLKTATPGTVSTVGETVTYSFEVTNTGNVTITDLAIDETAFSGTGTPPVIACPATTLAPAASTTCTGTYAVTQADLDAGEITNTATANGTDPAGVPVISVPDDAVVQASQSPALSLDKTTTATTYDSVGDLLPYNYLITNVGNVTITGAITVDDDRIVAPNSVDCPPLQGGGLVPGQSITCTATHVVTQADLDAGSVVNTATATDGTTVSPPDSETVDATQIASLVLDKTATVADTNGDGVLGDAGDTITYAFSVENTGNVDLEPVIVTDPLLPALSCSVPTLAPGDTASCAASGNTYVITMADEANGSVDNTALATGSAPGAAPDATDDDTATVPTLPTPATTTVVKAAAPASGTEVSPGDTITYTVTVTVADASLHEAVTLTDTIGPGLTFTAVTNASAFSCNAANPLICTLPVGTAPGSYDLVYTATVDDDATGEVGNSVVADKPPGVDPDPVCSACDTSHTVVPSTSTVSKSASPPGGVPVNPGDTITFTLTTVVNGSVTTEPITLVDTMDPGLTFVAVTDPGVYTCSGSLTCILPTGTLPGSYDVVYTATVDMDATGVLANTVVPSNPPGGDDNPVCDNCDTVHPVSRPEMVLEKEVTANDDADGNGEVSVGDTLTYTVTATNTGNVPLANVNIDDPLVTPDSTTCVLVPADGDCQLIGTYTVVQTDADAGEVLNTATVTTEAPPGVPPLPPEACPAGSTSPNCAAENVTPVIQRPAIAATKTAVLSVDNATPGKGNIDDVITYSVTATNTGNITLTDVVVNDTFQNGTPVPLSCAPTVLAPGQTATCASYEHTITEAEVHSEQEILLNTVLAEGNAGTVSGTVQVTATAAAEIEVQNEPAQLRLSKVAGVRQVNIGDLVRYTLTVENTGDIDLVDGYLIDTPAPGFTYVEGSLQGDDDDDFVTASGSSPLRVSDLDIAAGNTAIISYLMRVGAGVEPGVQINRAVAFDPAYDGPASNVATAEVVLGSDPLLDESLISGTVFNDRDGDGWQDSAALTDLRVQGGFAPDAYVPGSTTIDRGDGPQPEPDASAPLLRGIELDRIEGRQSVADPASAHDVVIRQHLREPAFTDDFVLTSEQGVTVRMAADGSTTVEKDGDAAEGLTAAAPNVQRQVAQVGDGYEVAYVVSNDGIADRGIPGVRIASVEGLLMETDQYGRYHLVGVDAGQSARGRNFILKVDAATLPPGAEFTTENPKLRRVTGGVPTRFDFGVRLPETPIRGSRIVEMEIGSVLFAPGSAQVQPHYLSVIDSMVEQVRQHGGGEVVIAAGGETEALAFARANAVRTLLDERLEAPLRGQVALSVRADADDPSSLVAGVAEGGPVLGTLLFDTDEATIQPRFDPLLDEVAKALAASGGKTVSIIGHADRRGSRGYNAALGLRRANAVYEALAQRLPPEVRQRLKVEVRDDPDAPLGTPQGEVEP